MCKSLMDMNLLLYRYKSELMLGGNSKQSRYRWMVVNYEFIMTLSSVSFW